MTVETQTPSEWAWREGVEILDADGWRAPDEQDFHKRISYEEFLERLSVSTIRIRRVGERLMNGQRWNG